MSDRDVVRQALQHGYGDATQTALDDAVAGDVLTALRMSGWASLSDVALLVLAAGGEVRLTRDVMRQANDPRLVVETYDDPVTLEKVVRVRLPSE